LEESISFLEQEVVFNELLLDGRVHAFDRVVVAFELTSLLLKNSCDLFLKCEAVCLANSRTQSEAVNISCDSNSSALDEDLSNEGKSWAVHSLDRHLGLVLGIRGMAVVLLDHLVHQGSEDLVTVMAASINSDTRVGVLASTENCINKTETFIVLCVLELLKYFGGAELGK
jgi:hypothetical protein